MGRIYMARHGETDWNAHGRLQGATDVPLNDLGRAQARALGELLLGEQITSVTTSDLSRAQETGAIAAGVLGVTNIEIDRELRERSFGIFEGLNRTELETQHAEAWKDWRERSIAPPDAEAVELIVARMKRALGRIFDRIGSDNALVVAHGAVMRLAMTDLLPHTKGPFVPIANGAVYRFERVDSNWSIEPWNRPA